MKSKEHFTKKKAELANKKAELANLAELAKWEEARKSMPPTHVSRHLRLPKPPKPEPTTPPKAPKVAPKDKLLFPRPELTPTKQKNVYMLHIPPRIEEGRDERRAPKIKGKHSTKRVPSITAPVQREQIPLIKIPPNPPKVEPWNEPRYTKKK